MFNKVIVVGRLTADPELKQTPSGVSVTTFSIAVNRSYAPKGQERQVDFFDIVAWRGTSEFISRYFSKGKAILIEGSIQTRSYVGKNGNNRRVWEIVADSAHFVESKNAQQASTSEPTNASADVQYGGSTEDFTEIDNDGDLPF